MKLSRAYSILLLFMLCFGMGFSQADNGITSIKLDFYDTTFCEGNRLRIIVPHENLPYHRIQWFGFTNNVAVPIYPSSDTIYIDKPGKYYYIPRSIKSDVADLEGDTINAIYQPLPERKLPTDTVFSCTGGRNIYFSEAQKYSDVSFRWSFGDTYEEYSDSVCAFMYTGREVDMLTCLMTNRCGASVMDTVIVKFNPPFVYIGKDVTLCPSDEGVKINANTYNPNAIDAVGYKFTWTLNGDTIDTGVGLNHTVVDLKMPKDTGELVVHVAADPKLVGECAEVSDTVQIMLYPFPDVYFELINDTNVCSIDSIEVRPSEMSFSPDAQYVWYLNDEVLDTTADAIFISEKGLYKVAGTNLCSFYADSFRLNIYTMDYVTSTLPGDTSKCDSISLVLDGTLPYSGNMYKWFKDGDPAQEELYEKWVWSTSGIDTITEAGSYTLYIKDQNECIGMNTINISEDDCSPMIRIPNVFTPNGDGVNETFMLKDADHVHDFEIKIFSRAGHVVYSYKGDANQFAWDGKVKNSNSLSADGVYFYIITYKDYKDRKKKVSGSVTLLSGGN